MASSNFGDTAQRKPRKVIGIITGSGPEAGVDLLQKVLLANRAALGDSYQGDKDAPSVLLRSVPELGGPHGFFDLREDAPDHQKVWGPISTAVADIAPLCDMYCVCCNTLHFLAPKLKQLPTERTCPLVSIVDATRARCARLGVDEAAVLGSQLISDVGPAGESPYAALPCAKPMAPQHRELAQQGLMLIKRHGPKHSDVFTTFEQLGQELRGFDCLVLACTELPLLDWPALFRGRPVPPLVDPTEVLAQELVRRSFGEPKPRAPGPAKATAKATGKATGAKAGAKAAGARKAGAKAKAATKRAPAKRGAKAAPLSQKRVSKPKAVARKGPARK